MAPPAAAAPAQGWTECRAFGVVSNSNTTALANTLRGLCYKYNTMKIYEAVLRVAGKNTCVKIQKRLQKRDPAKQSPFSERLPDRRVCACAAGGQGHTLAEPPPAIRNGGLPCPCKLGT